MTDLAKIVKKIQKQLTREIEAEVRRFWREEGWIYVREYTVQAHVRKRRPPKNRYRKH